jgi:dCTP deaminase
MADARAPTPAGTLGYDELQELVRDGAITSSAPIRPDQVQPASFDLTLAEEAYRMPGSILPLEHERVSDLVRGLALERLDLSEPRCLSREHVYAVKLRESFRLSGGLSAYTNGKSSAGRVDVTTRTMADGGTRYDRVPPGYWGELWIELIPRSFNVLVRAGVSLNQAIFFERRHVLSNDELGERYRREPLLFLDEGAAAPDKHVVDGRVVMTAELGTDIVGYVAKRTHRPLDLAAVAAHDPEDFFVPIERPRSGYLFLEKGNFYIFATHERIWVPDDLACEMLPYDATAGEFRAHYAGFFDPGWGIVNGEALGAKAVLEVRSHEDDLILRHGQPICTMAFETLRGPCGALYGSRNNSYAEQRGPTLSKHFR